MTRIGNPLPTRTHIISVFYEKLQRFSLYKSVCKRFCFRPILQAAPTAYLTGIPGASTQVGNTYAPYFNAGPLIGPTTIITSDPNNPLAMAVQQTMVTQQKMPRNDRLDVSTTKNTHIYIYTLITYKNITQSCLFVFSLFFLEQGKKKIITFSTSFNTLIYH